MHIEFHVDQRCTVAIDLPGAADGLRVQLTPDTGATHALPGVRSLQSSDDIADLEAMKFIHDSR